jgi:hypothetical protein
MSGNSARSKSRSACAPPLDAEAADAARVELEQLTALERALENWAHSGWIEAEVSREFQVEATNRIAAIRDRLLDAPPTELPAGPHLRLAQTAHRTIALCSTWNIIGANQDDRPIVRNRNPMRQ